MAENRRENLDIFEDSAQMTRAMHKAVQNALREHKLLGYPIVIWRDGQVVWVPPEEIELDEEQNGPAPKPPLFPENA